MHPDCQHLNSGLYIVRSPAGFRQALQHYDAELEPKGHPRSFPALIALSTGRTAGFPVQWIGVQSIALSDLAAAIEAV